MNGIWQVETNIDDMSPQGTEYVFVRLLETGAKDVWATPVIMKKGRPGIMLCALCEERLLQDVSTVILTETTSIGVRCFPVERKECSREIVVVRVGGRDIHCKVSRYDGTVTTITAEYDECRTAAAETGTPLKEWRRRAEEEAYKIHG